jgi:hypothetical protein
MNTDFHGLTNMFNQLGHQKPQLTDFLCRYLPDFRLSSQLIANRLSGNEKLHRVEWPWHVFSFSKIRTENCLTNILWWLSSCSDLIWTWKLAAFHGAKKVRKENSIKKRFRTILCNSGTFLKFRKEFLHYWCDCHKSATSHRNQIDNCYSSRWLPWGGSQCSCAFWSKTRCK